MKLNVPFSKSLALGKKVFEITGISLEHEFKIEKDLLKGEFLISGDYQINEFDEEVTPFELKTPFEIELGVAVQEATIDLEILDFTYDLQANDTLKVDIEFEITGEAKEEENIREINEEKFEPIGETLTSDLEEEFERIIEETSNKEAEETKAVIPEVKEKIINTVQDDDTYVCYNVHIVKDGESIESICALYNIEVSLLKDYNNLEEILTGDKLLIPTEGNE